MQLRLDSIRYASQDVHLFSFCADDRRVLPQAPAGAHICLHLGPNLRRYYSVLNSEATPHEYVIGVKYEPEGRGGSRCLHESLRVGSVLEIEGPNNAFYLAEHAPMHVLIAGGIGITPLYAMRNELIRRGQPYQLHYACKTSLQGLFSQELGKDPYCQHYYSQTEGGKLDLPQIITASPAGSHFYCCGPQPMLAAFEQACAGLDPSQVHYEQFQAATATSAQGTYIVELQQSGTEITVEKGSTILHSLLAAGIDVNYSCEQGICGVCETRVLEGTPEHRDMLLSDAEKEAGQSMMICCSGSQSPRLVLDL